MPRAQVPAATAPSGALNASATVPARPPARVRPAPAALRPARPAGRPTAKGEASATQRIVQAVTQAIVERRLAPGTKLAEQRLADIFAVSRTLVRQAFQQLARDKLITLTPARGAYVAQPSVEEAREVFQVRQMLEDAMLRRLASHIEPADLATLREHLRREAAAVARTDVGGRTALLAEFHVLLARLLGNQTLAEIVRDLVSRSSLISLMYQSAHSAEQSHAEHVALVEALARGDSRAARRLMAQHLRNVELHLRLHPRVHDLAAALRP